MYSMPPDHGAAIVARLLGDAVLRDLWEQEVASMTARMKSLRAMLVERLAARSPDLDFSWLVRQRGMFSLLGLDPAAVRALSERHHIYTPPDGRMNIAGISAANVDYIAESILALTPPGP
jgi:aspartate/tyrosine/aromatic aminotransferase